MIGQIWYFDQGARDAVTREGQRPHRLGWRHLTPGKSDMSRYEIRQRDDGTVVSRHRTRQGALDAWREQVPLGVRIVIVRTYADGREQPVVEGRCLGEQSPPV